MPKAEMGSPPATWFDGAFSPGEAIHCATLRWIASPGVTQRPPSRCSASNYVNFGAVALDNATMAGVERSASPVKEFPIIH